MKEVQLSVIIPCFNEGAYLMEAIESVRKSNTTISFEIIVVDDGSTNLNTLQLLEKISSENIKIIYQENKGPASARNTGIRQSKSNYLLFLDSDNKIRPGFINTSLNIFQKYPGVDIVYGKPFFFGDIDEKRIFIADKFDLDKIWFGNYIDMCSVVRKTLFQSIGMLDENPVLIGHEDWEYWIRAGIENREFYFIDETMFDYRMNSNSLITKANVVEKYEKMISYLYGKNYKYFQNKLLSYNKIVEMYNDEKNRPYKSFLRNLYHKYYKR